MGIKKVTENTYKEFSELREKKVISIFPLNSMRKRDLEELTQNG